MMKILCAVKMITHTSGLKSRLSLALAWKALGLGLLGSALLFCACGTGSNSSATSTATTTAPTATTAATPTLTPLKVSSVDLVVTPPSVAGATCGTSATFTYTATFHIPAGTAGGTIAFMYTVTNGRGTTEASVTVGPGQTTQTYTFSSSGILPSDHTYPGIAEVLVTSPNSVTSPQVLVAGSCTPPGAFKVSSITMAVTPSSIAGDSCGNQITVTYTATFHLAAGSPGGTIDFMYTVNNGRGSTNASVVAGPGQSTATYTFTWSGALPADHTYPSLGGVITSSPNVVNSPLVQPTGMCS
ncbi:MAG: hypothetical protein ACLQUY_01790 [Ktedonobacterales bacterium]